MRLYIVRSDPAFTLLRPASEELWRWRGGTAVEGAWEEAELTTADGGDEEFVAADCLELVSGVDGLFLSEFARNKIADLLAPAGEFWPVTVLGRRYWWFNCIACVEALDRDRTDADWSVVSGDWGSFKWITTTRRLAFTGSKLVPAPALFRVPEYPQGVLFGTEALAGAVESYGLTGFKFDRVWSAAEGGVVDPPGVSLAGVFAGENALELRRRRREAARVLKRRGSSGG